MTRTLRPSTILETIRLTFAGEMPFPQVVGALQAIGVERYTVDLCSLATTYFTSSGESLTAPLPFDDAPKVSAGWSAEDVIAAVRASQQKQIQYPEFLQRVRAAGCVSYQAYLDGRKVIYLSRLGDMHIEHFPV